MLLYRHNQRGGAAVEFALIAVLFATLLITITGFGHWMYTMEMATDATRTGARVAVVCDVNDARIREAIQERIPQLSLADSQVAVEYFPAGCSKSNCQAVRISLTGASYHSWIPFLPNVLAMPPLVTTLPRESLESVNGAGELNPTCL